MLRFAALATLVAATLVPLAAEAQGRRVHREPDSTGSVGQAPWSQPWQYDSGGDNDKHPSRPSYQQGGGQQTGGPARNLIGGDGFTISPR